MQRLTVRFLLLMAVLVISGAFSKTSDAPHSANAAAHRFTNYYWYTWPEDTYYDTNSVGNEEEEWWIYYDEPVNTDPTGATLIMRGFINNNYPHEFPPSVLLYVHPD